MNIKDKSLILRLDTPCEQCGSYTYEIRYKKPHVGLYCKCCGKYIKWLSKEEKKMYNINTPESGNEKTGLGATFIFLDDTPLPNKETTDEEVPW